jgi:hypothetical protein
MTIRRLSFAFFAIAMLCSMVREWRAPIVCARSAVIVSQVRTVR